MNDLWLLFLFVFCFYWHTVMSAPEPIPDSTSQSTPLPTNMAATDYSCQHITLMCTLSGYLITHHVLLIIPNANSELRHLSVYTFCQAFCSFAVALLPVFLCLSGLSIFAFCTLPDLLPDSNLDYWFSVWICLPAVFNKYPKLQLLHADSPWQTLSVVSCLWLFMFFITLP